MYQQHQKDHSIYDEDQFKVVTIIDGDTYDVLIQNKEVRIRMYGIDAPEKGMPFYKNAKNKLGELCFGHFVKIKNINTDRHGRQVAIGYLEDGRDLNLEMIKSGMAWHYKYYSADTAYASAETIAQTQKIGLWQDPNPTPPWEARKARKHKARMH